MNTQITNKINPIDASQYMVDQLQAIEGLIQSGINPNNIISPDMDARHIQLVEACIVAGIAWEDIEDLEAEMKYVLYSAKYDGVYDAIKELMDKGFDAGQLSAIINLLKGDSSRVENNSYIIDQRWTGKQMEALATLQDADTIVETIGFTPEYSSEVMFLVIGAHIRNNLIIDLTKIKPEYDEAKVTAILGMATRGFDVDALELDIDAIDGEALLQITRGEVRGIPMSKYYNEGFTSAAMLGIIRDSLIIGHELPENYQELTTPEMLVNAIMAKRLGIKFDVNITPAALVARKLNKAFGFEFNEADENVADSIRDAFMTDVFVGEPKQPEMPFGFPGMNMAGMMPGMEMVEGEECDCEDCIEPCPECVEAKGERPSHLQEVKN